MSGNASKRKPWDGSEFEAALRVLVPESTSLLLHEVTNGRKRKSLKRILDHFFTEGGWAAFEKVLKEEIDEATERGKVAALKEVDHATIARVLHIEQSEVERLLEETVD